MWKSIKDKLIWIGLSLLGIFSAFFLGKSQSDKEYKKQKLELKNLIKKQEKEIDRLESRKAKLKEEINDKLNKVKLKEKEIKRLEKNNKASRVKVDNLMDKYNSLKEEYKNLSKKEKETKKAIESLRESNNKLLESGDSDESYESISDIDDAMQSNSNGK